nr:pentatricopeptide repeat-containing protein At5g27460-like [Coffea arabica]
MIIFTWMEAKERSRMSAADHAMKMNSLGLIVNPYPFNEMMKLYIATSQHKKVLTVMVQMKQNRIPRNALSYNLWMNACAELLGVGSAEEVYKETIHDKNVVIGWSSLSIIFFCLHPHITHYTSEDIQLWFLPVKKTHFNIFLHNTLGKAQPKIL